MAKISQNQMAKLFKRLATSYTAGIDLRTAYQRETEIGSPSYRLKAKQVCDSLQAGKPLADSMASANGYFPELALSVVKAGEAGGRLEDSFSRLGKHYENLVKFRNNFITAIAWPAFELVFAIFLVGGLMAICDSVFRTLEKQPINWLGMGSTTGNVIAYFVLVMMFFGVLALLIVGTSRGWFGKLPMQIAMKIPLIGQTIVALAMSRFAWTMSVAENAGMSAVATADLALRATDNFYYDRLRPGVNKTIQSGESFYRAFKATDAIPNDVLIYIDNGETAGQLSETMIRCSEELQGRAEKNLKLIGTIGFVLMLLLTAGLVLAIVVAVMSGYVGMLNDLAKPGAFR